MVLTLVCLSLSTALLTVIFAVIVSELTNGGCFEPIKQFKEDAIFLTIAWSILSVFYCILFGLCFSLKKNSSLDWKYDKETQMININVSGEKIKGINLNFEEKQTIFNFEDN